MKLRVVKFALVFLMVVSLGLVQQAGSKPAKARRNTGMADASAVMKNYQQWRGSYARGSENRYLALSLSGFSGLSAEETNAYGEIRIDFEGGIVRGAIEQLPIGNWELWFINNRPGANNSSFADANDGMIKAATFTSDGFDATIDATMGKQALAGFSVDRAMVVRAGGNLLTGMVLTGAPTLFERLARQEERLRTERPAFTLELADFETMVARGRQIFLKETFGGNGRTCATCHPEDHNFTVDPEYIAKLPANDPIFVADFVPALAKNFQDNDKLRRFSVFQTNSDGFDKLDKKFVFRGANHLLGLSQTITRPDPSVPIDFVNFLPNPPQQRLGWSGDGAPGSGTLREFAGGAIMQFFTKSLNRKAGTDFRLPTDEEMDALEAFQLSIGRQQELDLTMVQLRNPLANRGQALYMGFQPGDGGVSKKCNFCHFNAGASFPFRPKLPGTLNFTNEGFNPNFAVGEDLLPQVKKFGFPLDGGFGKDPIPDGSFGNCVSQFFINRCSKEFNTPSLIEAADTPPYFHNHLLNTIEDAVAYYDSETFNNSEAGVFEFPPGVVLTEIHMTKDEVFAIAAFLRVLNGIENIRSSVAVLLRAQQLDNTSDAQELIRFAINDTNDALRVLTEGSMRSEFLSAEGNPVEIAVLRLNNAKSLLISASTTSDAGTRNDLINQALVQFRTARKALVRPETLPPSFNN